MEATEFELPQVDAKLHVYRWLPEGAPKAVLVVAHGQAEHAGRYARFAESLTGAGYAVYAVDHRGHGKTAPNKDDLGFFAESRGFDVVVADFEAVVKKAKEENPGLPLAVLGHSMGGTVVTYYMQAMPGQADAYVISSPPGFQGPLLDAGFGLAKVEKLRQGARGRSKLLDKISFGAYNDAFKPNRTEFDWLSRNPTEVDKYIADPLCGFLITNQMWIDHLGALRKIKRQDALQRVDHHKPVYIPAGDMDPLNDGLKTTKRLANALRGAGVHRVDERVYPGGRHELYNETNRDEIIADLVAWLDGALGVA